MSDQWLPPIVPAGSVPAPAVEDWRPKLIHTKDGSPKALLANAVTALRGAPELRGIAFDEFKAAVVIKASDVFNNRPGSEWTDHQDRQVTDWLQREGIAVSIEVAGNAVQLVARDRTFHPVREYFNSLAHDGTPHLDNLLSLYFGVEPSAYVRSVGSCFMRSAAARVFQPGCKADCVLILEGDQGIRKSTALRVIASPWFSDEIADLGSKDSAMQTRGVLLIEIAELAAMPSNQVETVKAFVSRPTDRFRPPYGRHLVESPRQCVFAGSINRGAYLRDDTGGRRFWPVRCSRILIDELARDRDQLWAEAVATYRAGEPWWLNTADLNRDAEDEQSQRYEESAWDGLIVAWAAERLEAGFDSVSVAEILDLCIKKQCGQWTRADEQRAGSSLRRAGWTRYRQRVAGGLQWRYRPPCS